jgi:zinc/manganese transport system permease protein
MESLLELRWMLPPFVICLVLVGIHGYLGIHVLERKVIFVDLALAQIAALGTTYAFMLGYDPKVPDDATAVYCFSLGFTVLGAAVFALTRMREERVPHEAFIGITYATASALAMLILSKTTAEGEHLKSMLVGNILLVTWPLILKTTAIYALVGGFHLVFYRRFLAISRDPLGSEAAGVHVRLWDFLFYVTFGFVITSSVSIAGVLLVFTYLVVPASFAILFAESFSSRIKIAWAMGTLCSMIGMVVSYYGDLPTGPSVVGIFTLCLMVGGIARGIRHAKHRLRAITATVAVALAVAVAGRASFALRKLEPEHHHGSVTEQLLASLSGDNETAQIEAIHHLTEIGDPDAPAAIRKLIDNHPSDRVLEHAAQALARFGDRQSVPALLRANERELDPDLRLTLAETILELEDARGLRPLIAALHSDPPLLTRRRATEILKTYFGTDFGYVAEAPDGARAEAVNQLVAWWKRSEGTLQWRSQTHRFE